MSIIAWIILGLLAGWIAGMLMHGSGYGIIGDLVLGILGAIIGGWLTGLVLGENMVSGLNIPSIIVAIIGAIILVAIARLFSGRSVRSGV
jgi:uncharacterized membrane protein YeaQ/YmgE (transglycosylase-associated protein family)